MRYHHVEKERKQKLIKGPLNMTFYEKGCLKYHVTP